MGTYIIGRKSIHIAFGKGQLYVCVCVFENIIGLNEQFHFK